MSNELRDLRLSSGLPAPEIAAAIREIFPKFDRQLLSKCERSEDYGIALLPRGMNAARALVPGWKAKKKDTHRNQFRIYARMDEATYTALSQKTKADGYPTMQAWIMAQIESYINE